jgi:hypothetical protein
MDLDREVLARIDRKVLSELDHDEIYRMARLPVSDVTWSTWKRYCDAAGISMGRALVAMIENELRSVVGESDAQPAFLAEFEDGLAARQRVLEAKEGELEARARRLRANERQIHFPPALTGND